MIDKSDLVFVTQSGTTYRHSFVSQVLYRQLPEGWEHVVRTNCPALTVVEGERAQFAGSHFDAQQRRWRDGYEVSTSRVVAVWREPNMWAQDLDSPPVTVVG